ncbi:MAG: hypothetical protein N2645_00080 [Clostridia bacterium]|nr:hypothetical protein [Clostridia bacterium]
MCNQCIYKTASHRRREIIQKIAYELGYYGSALENAKKVNDKEGILRYELVVELLKDLIDVGRL